MKKRTSLLQLGINYKSQPFYSSLRFCSPHNFNTIDEMPQVVHTEIRRQRDARLNQICAAGTKQSETESEQVENEEIF